MDKFFFPRTNYANISQQNTDSDTALILMLIMIIIRDKGDTFLIMALLYILT
ncbi:MAG: hypothetical protein IJB74_08215 [Clostridia bacterium]|nr:hypothetical protein [Clostridia bacterium]